MSLLNTYNFTTPSDYTYDADKIEVVDGKAQLKLSEVNNDYIETFDSDTGFTYDSNKAEFVGGLVRQKSQTPTNATFGATYTSDINGSWGNGVLTGTAFGGAIITGTRLNLTGGNKYVDYSAIANANSQQTGCIRVKVTPNYTGIPTAPILFVFISEGSGSSNNEVTIFHQSVTGNLRINIRDRVGTTIVTVDANSWNPVSGTTYEIEANWDVTIGASRLFVNGVLVGSDLVGTGIRSSSIGLLRVGANSTIAATSNCYIEDLLIFSTVQHTANYTLGYTVSEKKYVSNNVILPEIAHTGSLGALIALTGLTTTEVGSPRYTIQIGRSGDYLYWNGSAWATSDNTYAQSNPLATVASNIGTLDIDGELYIQFKTLFTDSNTTQQSVATLTASISEDDAYYTTNPSITPSTSFFMDGLDLFTPTASSGTRYILKKDGVDYYHNGTSWVISDGTYAQSNTSTEVTTNKATFTTTKILFNVKIFLHSAGTVQCDIDNLSVSYNFASPVADTISKCIVYGYVKDIFADDITVSSLTVALNTSVTLYKDSIVVYGNRKTITITDGYFEVELIETTNMDSGAYYVFTINKVTFNKSVPDEAYKSFNDLVTV